MKAENKNTTLSINQEEVAFQDFKSALLVVSLLANAFILSAWLTLQVTDRYNAAVVNVLLG